MSRSFNIRLAGTAIGIEPMYDYIREYCREYITDEKAAFTVKTEAADIAYEREKSDREAVIEGHKPVYYSDEYLETLSVYRKIAEKMPFLDTLLFHGSVIAVDNVGYLFTAKSGTGKSTHTRLWRELFGERAVMINDDKPLLRITENGVTAYGTPWDGKHRLSTNTAVPLKAVCILTRSEENFIEKITPKEAYQLVLQQTYRPVDRLAVIQSLKLIDSMLKTTGLYRLGCNISPDAARVAFEGMNGGII